MFGLLQTGAEFIISWAVSNSDPANLLLLSVVYIKLRRNHSDVCDRLKSLEERVDTHIDQNGGDS